MRKRVIAWFCLIVLMTGVPVLAQGGSSDASSMSTGNIGSILAGGVAPQTLQLKDLDNSWQAFRLSGNASEGNSLLDVYLLYAGQSPSQNTFYTQGKTVTISDQTFLVAYHIQQAPLDLRALMRSNSPPTPKPITADTTLSLCLINIRSIGVMNDIQQFDLNNVVSSDKAAKSALNADIQQQNDEAQTEQTISNLKQLALAMLMYSQDHNEKFPPMKTSASVKKALMRYAKAETIFVDQRDGQAFLPNPRISGKSLADIDAPASTVAFYDPVPDSLGKIYIAFADGHVKGVTSEEWEKIKRASKIP
jgi:prepilin-type processing-associated H-X9-DG protein